jgi:putative oxidoreductase
LDIDQPRKAGVAAAARDVSLIAIRAGLAWIMIEHAVMEWNFAGQSLAGVGDMFSQVGVPLAVVAGPANVIGEFVGGIALAAGLAVRAVGVLMAINMLGAWLIAHLHYSLFDGHGPAVVIAVGLLSLSLAITGSGRLGLDWLVGRRRRQRAE